MDTAEKGSNLRAFDQVVSNLKQYPLLQVSLAGCFVLVSIMVFDVEKIGLFKWLLHAIILGPLLVHIYLHVVPPRAKRALAKGSPCDSDHSGMGEPKQASVRLRVSGKAVAALVLVILVLMAVSESDEAELLNPDLALGLLIFSVGALLFSLLALWDIGRGKARGRVLAIVNAVLASVFVLAALGWLTEGPRIPY